MDARGSREDTGGASPARFPVPGWLPRYRGAWLWPDLAAGLSLAALLVPLGMAYAELAGVPPQAAFHAAPVALVAYAVFGPSRRHAVTVSAAAAAISAAAVSEVAARGTPEYVALTALLAVLAGAVSLGLGALRLGRIARLFSQPVRTGFAFGVALVVAARQLPGLFGVEAAGEGLLPRLYRLVAALPQTHLPTLLSGITTLALLLALGRWLPRVPAALAALAFGIALSSLLGLEGAGVAMVGDTSGALVVPRISWVDAGDALALLPAALGIALVAFADSAGPSSARGHGGRADREMVALGAANLGAGLFQGFPVGAGHSRSASTDAGRGHTQAAALAAASLASLAALFLAPLCHALPRATLAAIVVATAMGTVDRRELWRLREVRPGDFVLALASLTGVLLLDVLPGLGVAVALSLLALAWRASRPDVSVLGWVRGEAAFEDVRERPDARPVPGLLIVRPSQGLYFANAAALRERVVALVREGREPVDGVVLDLEESGDLDVPGADMLRELHAELEGQGVSLRLARVHRQVRALLDRAGITACIGAEHVHPRITTAVLDHLGARGGEAMEERMLLADSVRRMREVVRRRSRRADGAEQAYLAEVKRRLEELDRVVRGGVGAERESA